jgi:hypothetical protein
MSVSKRLRFQILNRDCFTCRYCGRSAPHVVLEVDHVEPVSRGGSNHPDNLVTACWECNRGKRALDAGRGIDASERMFRLRGDRDRVLDAFLESVGNEEPVRRRVELLVDELAYLQGVPTGDVWDWLHSEIPIDE